MGHPFLTFFNLSYIECVLKSSNPLKYKFFSVRPSVLPSAFLFQWSQFSRVSQNGINFYYVGFFYVLTTFTHTHKIFYMKYNSIFYNPICLVVYIYFLYYISFFFVFSILLGGIVLYYRYYLMHTII